MSVSNSVANGFHSNHAKSWTLISFHDLVKRQIGQTPNWLKQRPAATMTHYNQLFVRSADNPPSL